jgi:hypothetical protein
MQGILYEFEDLDLPNEVGIVASFVLVPFSAIGSGEPINQELVNFGGDLSTATERADE